MASRLTAGAPLSFRSIQPWRVEKMPRSSDRFFIGLRVAVQSHPATATLARPAGQEA